jgi:hypothetical protein
LTEIKAQLSSDERKKEIDGIRKTIVNKMEGTKGKKRSCLLPSFRVHLVSHPLVIAIE